jgi:hypothetical protein
MKYLLLLIGLLSCRDPFCSDKSDQTMGLAIRVLDNLQTAYDQQRGEDLGRFGIRISSLEEYKRVFASCCAIRLDSIDFAQYEILGLTTINRGRNSSYIREVKRDNANKKIVYTVTEEYCQRSSPVLGNGNFVLVAKLPSDYTVEYIRHQ